LLQAFWLLNFCLVASINDKKGHIKQANGLANPQLKLVSSLQFWKSLIQAFWLAIKLLSCCKYE